MKEDLATFEATMFIAAIGEELVCYNTRNSNIACFDNL